MERILFQNSLELLQRLIQMPSFSREEDKTAGIIQEFFDRHSIPCIRQGNNVWAFSAHFDVNRPTILLNSHHDTVCPNTGWTLDPFTPVIEGDILYGLGSNDAGASLVALMGTFAHYYNAPFLPFNLVMAASAEEEIIGSGGIESILPALGTLSLAIVGEPTGMQLAIAEKGLVVLDCTAFGVAGHAARKTGVNAISKAIRDIEWFHSYEFPQVSALLGPISMTTTVIQAGSQHNVIPDRCHFVVDIRTTDVYTNEEVVEHIREHVESEVIPRSTRLRPSSIRLDHPIVLAAQSLGISTFASPTMSDQTVIPFPSVKIGPGLSERSHTADEFIRLTELEQGITLYISLIDSYIRTLQVQNV